MQPQIKYDEDANIISIRISGKKSIDSEIKGNVVVDYDKNNEIVNIEIMKINMSEFAKIQKFIPSIRNFVNA